MKNFTEEKYQPQINSNKSNKSNKSKKDVIQSREETPKQQFYRTEKIDSSMNVVLGNDDSFQRQVSQFSSELNLVKETSIGNWARRNFVELEVD